MLGELVEKSIDLSNRRAQIVRGKVLVVLGGRASWPMSCQLLSLL